MNQLLYWQEIQIEFGFQETPFFIVCYAMLPIDRFLNCLIDYFDCYHSDPKLNMTIRRLSLIDIGHASQLDKNCFFPKFY